MGLPLTIFPGKSNHHSMQCYITAKIRLSKRQYNLFRGKRRTAGHQFAATFNRCRVGSGWLCIGVPIYQEYADWLINSPRQLCCALSSANKICLNGDSHNADFPLYRCGGACEISTNIVTNNRGSRLCHYLETFHRLLTVREHSSL